MKALDLEEQICTSSVLGTALSVHFRQYVFYSAVRSSKINGLQVATALCTVLNACLGRLPDALIRTKFVDCSKVVMAVMDHQHEEVCP